MQEIGVSGTAEMYCAYGNSYRRTGLMINLCRLSVRSRGVLGSVTCLPAALRCRSCLRALRLPLIKGNLRATALLLQLALPNCI